MGIGRLKGYVKHLARRVLGRAPVQVAPAATVPTMPRPPAPVPEWRPPYREPPPRVYETQEERDERLRGRNKAFEQAKERRRELWETGFRPPPSRALLPVPESAYAPDDLRPEALARSAEKNVLDVIHKLRSDEARALDKHAVNNRYEDAARCAVRLQTIDDVLTELYAYNVGGEP